MFNKIKILRNNLKLAILKIKIKRNRRQQMRIIKKLTKRGLITYKEYIKEMNNNV